MGKLTKLFLFAGLSREKFKHAESTLILNNFKMLNFLTVISFSFFGICGLLGFFIPGMQDKRMSYLIGAGVSVLALIINLIAGKKKLWSIIAISVFEIAVLGAGTLITLWDAPEQLTVTLIPLLVIVPILFTIKPWRTNLILLAYVICYLIIAPFVKPNSILFLDIVDVVVFSLVGIILGTLTIRSNVDRVLAENEAIHTRNQLLDMFKSFSTAYNSMHFIHLKDNYVNEFSTNAEIKSVTDKKGNIAEMMREIMRNTMTEEYLDQVLEFTDLNTVQGKLFGNKSINLDVLSKTDGWLRLEFTAIDIDADGFALSVIFTTKSIEAEKIKENSLINESRVDELTGCYNRRAFENDTKDISIGPDSEYVYISLDVNGLKVVNDSKGHAAGDELLSGAARCMQNAFGRFGKVYRMGGDEFSIIINADSELLFNLNKNFVEEVVSWKGELVNNLAIAFGSVVIKDLNAKTFNDVIVAADKLMYENKDLYYINKGVNRKEESDAYIAICRTYTKILKCSIINDTFRIINFDGIEEDADVYNGKISLWLEAFANSDLIHPDDSQYFKDNNNLAKLKEEFEHGQESVMTKYRRRYGDHYEDAIMEVIKTPDFNLDNLNVYVFVKSINK